MLGAAPVPVGQVEDLRGVVRALYASTAASEAVRRAKLRAIGEDLTKAIRLAKTDQRGAWRLAEDASERLGMVIGALEGAEPMVRAAIARVVRKS